MERILSLTDDELRAELSVKGYYPPPIQDDVTRRILRKKLAFLIDPSLVIEEPVQNPDSSDNSDSSDAAGEASIRSRNRVRFSEPQETVYEVTENHKRGFFWYAIFLLTAIVVGYLVMKDIDIISFMKMLVYSFSQ
ncbi:hypothetical protein MS3_00008154 [Schistosoma haematobium]|uniref:LEM domain-containing protein n=1 Tax=Schistosoma haematobium TaxID=6185 RepID=A0A922LGV7_SCHHA|nr:hypothetical protein MS3_00008154 [Schistosoma haematobium]KAH9583891.1 hypothetical protein MS3_00008154 [Schistosoma haematobium]